METSHFFLLLIPILLVNHLTVGQECPMMKKDLLGGASLIDIVNIETWEDCGAICNHISGCTGFSWGTPGHPIEELRKKCHLKSGSVTDNINDNADIVSGLVGCPPPSPVIATDCSMMDKDLLGGASLVTIKNIETWQDCGALCNHINGCSGFSWGSPDHSKKGLQNKCFLKSGSVTDNINDSSGIVSGLVGCPVTECSMMDTDLLGGLPLVDFENIQTWQDCGTLCNHVNGCAGFSWGSADHAIVGIQKKCHLKSGNVTDNIVDNSGVVSGLIGCPTPSSVIATNCSMMDKDLIGGAPLLDIENVEMWQDCGALCNHFDGCTGFSWGSPDFAIEGIQKKCHLKSGNATDKIVDNSGIVSGIIGCPLIDCSMMDKDLLGGLPLIEIENIETWHHCGALCNHFDGCTGFSWGKPDHATAEIRKKCHLKSGNVTDNVVDNSGIVSGLAECPTPTPVFFTNCSMMGKDLKGGSPLIEFENIESWHHCGSLCNIMNGCTGFSWVKPDSTMEAIRKKCHLKSGNVVDTIDDNDGVISGLAGCPSDSPLTQPPKNPPKNCQDKKGKKKCKKLKKKNGGKGCQDKRTRRMCKKTCNKRCKKF